MIRRAINEYVRVIERQFPDRTKTVGASEIGVCARKVSWAKHPGGLEDKDLINRWGAHIRGQVMEEEFWYPALRRQYREKLLFAGPDQRTFSSGPLSATPDGLVTDLPRDALAHLGVPDIESDCIVVESKTVDPRVNMTKEKDTAHFQVQVQMGLIRETTEFKPTYALISYIDASFWDEVDEYPVRFDEGLYEAAKVRAQKILDSDPQALPPEGYIAGGQECEWCKMATACGIIRRSVPEGDGATADPQFVAEIADMCRDAVDAKQAEDQAGREVREVQQNIKDRLREKSVRKIPGVVVWSTVKPRNSYDMAALRAAASAAGINIDDFATAGEPTDRLQILLGRPAAG